MYTEVSWNVSGEIRRHKRVSFLYLVNMLKSLVFVTYVMVITSAATNMFTTAKTHVIVENHLNTDLSLHCWSSEDDLGTHILGNGESFSWSFNVNFFGSTKFQCDLLWGKDGNQSIRIFGGRDQNQCDMHCW